MKTGEALKKARTDAGITQAELAKRLGVTPQTVSQYERGIKKPKVETLARFADAMSVEQLIRCLMSQPVHRLKETPIRLW